MECTYGCKPSTWIVEFNSKLTPEQKMAIISSALLAVGFMPCFRRFYIRLFYLGNNILQNEQKRNHANWLLLIYELYQFISATQLPKIKLIFIRKLCVIFPGLNCCIRELPAHLKTHRLRDH